MKSPYIERSVVVSPVALLLIKAGSRLNAMTVSLFSEVAHHPTTLWVSIAGDSYTHELLGDSPNFSLTMLRKGQEPVAQLCGSVSGRVSDKCARLDLGTDPDGFLYLRDALAYAACRVRSAHEVGDHTLFVADILAGGVDTRRSHLRHLLVSDLG